MILTKDTLDDILILNQGFNIVNINTHDEHSYEGNQDR